MDEVVVHFDVLSPGVEHGVASEVDAAHIVAEDANGIRKGVGEWGGHQCGRDHLTFCCGGRTCVWKIENKIRTKRERDTHTQRGITLLSKVCATVTNEQQQQQPFQKVTKSLYIVTHLGQLPFMLFTQMAQTWAIKEDSVNTSIIHWYLTCMTWEQVTEDYPTTSSYKALSEYFIAFKDWVSLFLLIRLFLWCIVSWLTKVFFGCNY